MQTKPLPKTDDGNYPDGSLVFDHKASVAEVMEAVEGVISEASFEIIEYDTGSDSFCYEIIRKCVHCGMKYEPSGHADTRCKNCGQHQD